MSDPDKQPWIPLVVPCPHLFEPDCVIPDLSQAEGPYLLELTHAIQAVKLQSFSPPRVARTRFPKDGDLYATIPLTQYRPGYKALIKAIPRYIKDNVFTGGYANYGLYIGMQQGFDGWGAESSFLHATITRSFIMLSSDIIYIEPMYRADRINWLPTVRAPDLPAGPVPLQVVIPLEWPSKSRHEQVKSLAHLDEDLRFMSIARWWGEPMTPVWMSPD